MSKNTFDLMISEFKDFSDLKTFSEAQFKTIIQLNQKIKSLEEEKTHLKKLLETSTPLLETDKAQFISTGFDISNEELICLRQLELLKNESIERELTLEETRKVEIYSKILTTLKNAPKTIKLEAKQLSDKELLALVDKDNDTELKNKH